MSANDENKASEQGRFVSTHWTVVFAAAQTQSPEAQRALEELCQDYRDPLCAFARHKGLKHEDAEDVTQQFFASRVITKLIFKGVNPLEGKFRTWLLNSFQNFIHNERAKLNAQKRGGGAVHLSMDAQDTEGNCPVQPACDPASELVYDRAWAANVLNRAMACLRAGYDDGGESVLYERLSRYLPGRETPPAYTSLAAELGLTEAALKMRVSRLRRELGQAVRAELKRTVATEGEMSEELRYLLMVIGS